MKMVTENKTTNILKIMNMNKIFIIISFAFILSACEKQQLDTWNDKGRVWFSNKKEVATFKKFSSNINEIIHEIPITLAGKIESYNREINIVVSKDKRNPQTRYEIQTPVVIESGASSALLKVKIFKTDNISQVADTVDFEIKSSNYFDEGLSENLNCKLVITNKYSKPWWWYDYACGVYTESKHEVLFAVFGNDNDIRGSSSESSIYWGWYSADALYNLFLLNKYCQDNGLSFRFN